MQKGGWYRYVFWTDGGGGWFPYNTIPVTDSESVKQLLAGLKVSKKAVKECKIVITERTIVLPSKIDASFFESLKKGGALLETPNLEMLNQKETSWLPLTSERRW